MNEQFTNLAQTTLNTTINNSTTSVIVNSVSGFPTVPQFRIIIDREIMLVTAISGTTYTVTRGVESTTANSHSSGANVTHVITAASVQAIATNPIGSINNRGQGMYLGCHFEQNQLRAYIVLSSDAISWSLLKPNAVYNPSGGVRDPAIYFDGTTYWMAYTRVTSPTASWGLASSPDLINWTHVVDVDESGVASTVYAWGPEFFLDTDNVLHIILALGTTTSNLQLYETHPTNAGMTTWSTAVAITGTSLPSDMIDPFMLKSGSTYYLFYKNDTNKYYEVMTSTSLTSGYVVQGSGHWMSNWPVVSGNGWEGMSIVQVDSNTWYAFVDSTDVSDNGLGYYYSVYTGSPGAGWLTGSNWSALAVTNDPFVKRHGTVLRIQDFITLRNCLAGFMSGPRNLGSMVSGATSVPNNATTILTYSKVWDDISYFDGSTKFTVTTSGFYQFDSYTHWPANGTGIRIIEIRKNGSSYLNGRSDDATKTVTDVRQQVSATWYLFANDYIEVAVYQNSGTSLTPTAQTFSIVRLL